MKVIPFALQSLPEIKLIHASAKLKRCHMFTLMKSTRRRCKIILNGTYFHNEKQQILFASKTGACSHFGLDVRSGRRFTSRNDRTESAYVGLNVIYIGIFLVVVYKVKMA